VPSTWFWSQHEAVVPRLPVKEDGRRPPDRFAIGVCARCRTGAYGAAGPSALRIWRKPLAQPFTAHQHAETPPRIAVLPRGD